MIYIKRIMLMAFVLGLCVKSFADIEDCVPLKEGNGRVLSLLSYLTELDMEKTYLTRDDRGNMIYDFAEEIALVDKIENPMEMAKAILISYILRSGGIEHIALDRHYCAVDIPCMERFKEHKDFLEAMALIERHLRLDAGTAYMFSEVLWAARNSAGVREKYADRIAQVENGILKNGSAEKKEALKREIAQRLMKEGKIRYLYGDFDGAKGKFLEAQGFETENKEAASYLALIEKKQEEIKNSIYKEGFTCRFNEALDLSDKLNNEAGDRLSNPLSDKLSQKDLDFIIIPRLNFKQALIDEVLDTLTDIVSKNRIAYASFAFTGDATAANKITLRLYNISLSRALELIAERANCNYRISGSAIIFENKKN